MDALVSGKGLSGRGLHCGHSPLQAPLVREQLVGKCSHLTPPPVGVLMSRPSASVSPPCRKPTLASQGVFPSGEYWFAHIPCPVGLLTPRVPSVRSHPVSVGLLTPHVCGFAHTPCPISLLTPRVCRFAHTLYRVGVCLAPFAASRLSLLHPFMKTPLHRGSSLQLCHPFSCSLLTPPNCPLAIHVHSWRAWAPGPQMTSTPQSPPSSWVT